MKSTHKAAALATALLATTLHAQCLTHDEVDSLVGHYFSKTVAATPPAFSEEDGACSRAKVNARLSKRLGKVIGYKAGLTNPAVQQRFNYDKPVWGIL